MKQQETRPEDAGRQGQGSVEVAGSTQLSAGNDGLEHAGKWAMLAIVGVGVFMATLDSSIVNISLPTIAHDFGVPLSGAIEWVVIGYLVAMAALLLTAGRLADMVGRKAVWLVGLTIFICGSALCGLAPSLPFLIASRAFQGIGGALIMAVSPAMLINAFPAHERGRALGFNAVTVALGVSVGPTLGGLLTAISWRWIFYVNVPIGIIGLIASVHVLTERLHRNPGRFDPTGAILLAIGLAGLTAGLSFGQELGWTSPTILTVLLLGVAALVTLPFVEQRVANPIIQLSLLRSRVFLSANLSLIISFLAIFAVSFMLPFYLEELKNLPTEQAGLLLTPLPITLALIAPLSGTLADRVGTRWLAFCGLGLASIGLVFVSQLNAQSSVLDIIWRLMLIGAGQALFQSPNNSALLGSAPRAQQGSASGFLATGRVFGQSLSVALAGAIFTGLGGAAAGLALAMHRPGINVTALQQTFVNGFHVTFIVCACIAALGAIASLTRGKDKPEDE